MQNNDYARQAREHHKRMLSHLQTDPDLPPLDASMYSPKDMTSNRQQSISSSASSMPPRSPPPLSGQPDIYEEYDRSLFMTAASSNASMDGCEGSFKYQPGVLPTTISGPFPQQTPSYGFSYGQPTYDPYQTQAFFGYSQSFNIPQEKQPVNSTPFAVDPQYLNQSVIQPDNDEGQLDIPASPLLSISGSESPLPADDYKSRLRRTSAPEPFGEEPRSKGKKHKRKMTWTVGMEEEGPNVPQSQKEQELLELSRLEQGGAATRRERRRLQNRLAQRAFRARSKIHNVEAVNHLTDLEQLAEMQADQLRKMNEALEKLQRENTALKAESWAKANAERAHYNKGAGPAGP